MKRRSKAVKIITVILLNIKYILIYLGIISLVSVIVCVADKLRARKGKWRVRESTLFLLSFLGGSLAMYITMLTIRHKTLHKRFMIGLPLIIIIQAAVLITIYFKIPSVI